MDLSRATFSFSSSTHRIDEQLTNIVSASDGTLIVIPSFPSFYSPDFSSIPDLHLSQASLLKFSFAHIEATPSCLLTQKYERYCSIACIGLQSSYTTGATGQPRRVLRVSTRRRAGSPTKAVSSGNTKNGTKYPEGVTTLWLGIIGRGGDAARRPISDDSSLSNSSKPAYDYRCLKTPILCSLTGLATRSSLLVSMAGNGNDLS
jgi:hypothetical protein